MKLSTLTRVFICLLTTTTLLSCEDHRLMVGNQRFRIKEVTSRTSRVFSLVQYNYNSSSQIASSIRYTSVPSPTTSNQTTLVEYDVKNRLISTEQQPPVGLINQIKVRTEYGYDVAGNLSIVRTLTAPNTSNDFQLANTLTLEYTSSMFPVKITATGSGVPNGVTEYTYADGNVSREVFTPVDPGQPSNTRLFQYDDKPNPFYGKVIFGVDAQIFSKNNAVDPSRRLIYDANGFLVREEPSSGNTGPLNEVDYKYETY